MANVASALERVKQNLHEYLPVSFIEKACKEAGHHWRERLWGPVATLQLFVLQMLYRNTAITHLRHLADTPVNAAAYCKARMRLPLAALQTLLEQSALAITGARGQRLWCGLRTYLVDASSVIAPDTPDNQKRFPQPKGQKKGCGFPVPKLLGLFDAYSGLLRSVFFTPLYTHDLPGAVQLHSALGQGDLLVGDRAFCSFAHFALLSAREALALFRLNAARKVSFGPQRATPSVGHKQRRRQQELKAKNKKGKNKKAKGQKIRRAAQEVVKRLGHDDQVVRWLKPRECYRPQWMPLKQYRQLPDEMLIRQLRFKIGASGGRTREVTIATTLLDPKVYPKKAIAELYGLRWNIEKHFGQLKTTLHMRRIKCQTAEGVQKEILMYALVYNLVHAVMLQAAERQKVPPDRISFLDTLRWILEAPPGAELPNLLINPPRKGRHQPRVVKDRHDSYPRMNQPRSTMNRNPLNYPGRK